MQSRRGVKFNETIVKIKNNKLIIHLNSVVYSYSDAHNVVPNTVGKFSLK